jgi:hypothetical protein
VYWGGVEALASRRRRQRERESRTCMRLSRPVTNAGHHRWCPASRPWVRPATSQAARSGRSSALDAPGRHPRCASRSPPCDPPPPPEAVPPPGRRHPAATRPALARTLEGAHPRG